VGLGSNQNDREANIAEALKRLAEHPLFNLIASSSIYQTMPVGVTQQPFFLNAAAKISTSLEPVEFLTVLKSMEKAMGRRKSFRWGPRRIDLDLLLYDDVILDGPDLTIPHQELCRRAFVLVPLAEIAPQLIEPRSGKRIVQLLKDLGSIEGVRLYHSGGKHHHG
jgi:2-amino-4-hydroxy-6-hydroxymethyldihydropteridine diphosphokinase